MSKAKVVVTIDDSHIPSIQSVADHLRSAGLEVEQVLETSGIIIGEVEQEKRTQLRSVNGVADVESDGEMRAI